MNLKNCPSCNGKGTVRMILWGMPAEEPDPDKYVVGGCCVSPTGVDPTHECINCGWQRFDQSKKIELL